MLAQQRTVADLLTAFESTLADCEAADASARGHRSDSGDGDVAASAMRQERCVCTVLPRIEINSMFQFLLRF